MRPFSLKSSGSSAPHGPERDNPICFVLVLEAVRDRVSEIGLLVGLVQPRQREVPLLRHLRIARREKDRMRGHSALIASARCWPVMPGMA